MSSAKNHLFRFVIKNKEEMFYCQFSVILLGCQERHSCNLQAGVWGWQRLENSQEPPPASGWFKGAVAVNLFTHKVESLAHSDNPVNSNQDPVISNYSARVARASGSLFTTRSFFTQSAARRSCEGPPHKRPRQLRQEGHAASNTIKVCNGIVTWKVAVSHG